MIKLNEEVVQYLEEKGAPKKFVEIKEFLDTETTQLGFGAFDNGIIFMGARFADLEYSNSGEVFEFDATFTIEKEGVTFTGEIVGDELTKESEEYKELAEKISELGFKFIELGQTYENTITHGIVINYSSLTSEKLEAVAKLWFDYNQENLENLKVEEDFNDGNTGYNLSLDEL